MTENIENVVKEARIIAQKLICSLFHLSSSHCQQQQQQLPSQEKKEKEDEKEEEEEVEVVVFPFHQFILTCYNLWILQNGSTLS